MREADAALFTGKVIRMARAPMRAKGLAAGSEGSHRRELAHSESEPDSAD